MKFIWTPGHSVGIKKFDEQHQQYFSIANKIYDLIDQKDVDRDQLFSQIMELANYSSYHLSSEEDAFKKYAYPGIDSHILAHNILRKKVQESVEKCMTADTDLVIFVKELVDFASTWLAGHIDSADKLYTEFLKDKEI